MWKFISSLLFSLLLVQCRYHSLHSLLVSLSQGVSCGSGDIVLTMGVNATIQCSGAPSSVTITPFLPKGLTFSDGRIHGTPLEGSPLTRYAIEKNGVLGYFYLGGLSFEVATHA